MAGTPSTGTRFSRTVHVGLGFLLLAAAGLKLAGLEVAGVDRVGFFATPWVQMFAVEWELLLGLWLIWGQFRLAAWTAAVATFLLFACISAYNMWLGQVDRGCLGVMSTRPWTALSIDLVALLLLLGFTRPDFRHFGKEVSDLRGNAICFLGVVSVSAALVVVTLGLASAVYGSLSVAQANLRGDPVTADPSHIHIGSARAGSVAEFSVLFRNLTDRPVSTAALCLYSVAPSESVEVDSACSQFRQTRFAV